MKSYVHILAVVVALFLSAKVHAQIKPDLRCIIDTVLLKAKQTSLNSHEVLWDSVKFNMYKKAKNAKSVSDLRPSFEFLLNALNDRHGKFINTATNSTIATFTAVKNSELSAMQVSSHTKNVGGKFEFKVLEEGIGYLKIANISMDADVQKEAETIRSAIDSLEKGEPQKWILDLRYNNDGNVNPIIAGIASLLGEGQVGGVVDGKNKIQRLFEIHNGNFYNELQQLVAKFPCAKQINDSKIAVLIGHYTAGPGEMVAITLKGRKNTKFFGEPTAGYLAVTKRIPIGKDLIMSITESLIQDRIGNAYRDNLEPDKLVAFEPSTKDRDMDKGIAEAIEWLNFDQTKLSQLVSN